MRRDDSGLTRAAKAESDDSCEGRLIYISLPSNYSKLSATKGKGSFAM